MTIERYLRVRALAAVMPAANIDTDVIMPKQFLKGIDREGLAVGLFHDLRFSADGVPDPAFVLNQPQFERTEILVTGPNFGCGSSREHAIWGMLQYGIRAIIGTSFAGIFADNAANNGLLIVTLDEHAVGRLADIACAAVPVTIDLEACTIEAGGETFMFRIDPLVREALMSGLDRIGQTLSRAERIRAFERSYLADSVWLADEQVS